MSRRPAGHFRSGKHGWLVITVNLTGGSCQNNGSSQADKLATHLSIPNYWYRDVCLVTMMMIVLELRLRSHRHEYEFGFQFTARRSFTRMSGAFKVTCTSTTKCVSAILNKIKLKKCYAITTTIFYYKVTIFTNCTSLTMNISMVMSVLTSYVCHGFYKLY